MTDQVKRGTHYGAEHELQITWAEQLVEMVPSAERVRFTTSGNDAVLLALRDARAFTGHEKIIRFAGHFHGWLDYATVGYQPPFETPSSLGIPRAVTESMLVAFPNQIESVGQLLDRHPNGVAAVILEPAGGSNGIIPTDVPFLRALRTLTQERGVLLIFDEMSSGFRFGPGGAQETYGVLPDLTILAKVLTGGLPGGAVAGRADIMDLQAFTGELHRDRYGRVLQQGTFSANPLSAAAGVATLRLVAEGWPCAHSSLAGQAVRIGMREALERRGVEGIVLGDHSIFQVLLGEGVDEAARTTDVQRLMAGRGAVNTLRKAMLLNGVDLIRSGGFLSIAHTGREVEQIVEAFGRSLPMLQREGML